MTAYEEMLQQCSTTWAPWHIIPANQKWYRNLAIIRTIVHTLREMNPQYPEAEKHLDQVVIEVKGYKSLAGFYHLGCR